MKKIFTCLFAISFAFIGNGQAYFQATMQNNENNLTFKIRPVNGDMQNIRFSAIEFFVRYPNTSPAFTWGTPAPDAQFPGMNFVVHGPNYYGSEPGYTNWVFEWIGGATFIPATPTTYTENTEYTVFTVPLLGSPNTVDLEFIHNTSPDMLLAYINISDYLGNSLSCIDNFGNTIGNAFYGPGFHIDPSPNGYLDHLLPLDNVPVPVKFTSFMAEKRGNDGLLTWNVENESSVTDHYEIERSINGTDFTSINRMDAEVASGNTSNVYTYTDHNLKALQSNVIYYRIRQVDKDSHSTYSVVRTIRLDGRSFGVQVFPNPIHSTGTIRIDLVKNSKISIVLYDASGKEVQKNIVEGIEGVNHYRLSMQNLAAGSYQLKVIAGSDSQSVSVVKAK